MTVPVPSATTSGATGVPLHVRYWIPTSPRALVVVVHGVGEHGGRYAEFAAALGGRGFGVVAHDHQGHGLSPGRRGDVRRFAEYADDLACVLASVREDHPSAPLFLLGHSMGAVVAAQLIQRGASDLPVTGLILSSPGFVPVVPVAAGKRLLAKVLVHVCPSLALPTGIMPEQLSRDAGVVKSFRADPLTGKVSVRWYTGFSQACRECLARAPSVTLPLYALHGTADTVVALSGTERFVRAARSADKTLRIWPGLRHETLNESEPDRSEVIGELIAWLEQRDQVPRTSGLG
jgi:acylglycerol lipase